VIANSLADMDVANPTFLEILKQILLQRIDMKAPTLELADARGGKPAKADPHQLSPIDCAMFMTAYTRCKMFTSVDLLESLEASFLSRIDEANGPTLVTMFNSHAAWCAQLVDECVLKKEQPRQVFKSFKKYNS
jgi:hypothetical protein